MNTITAFLKDLKIENSKKYGANLLDGMIAESEKKSSSNIWITASPTNQDYKSATEGLGVFVSHYKSGGQVNRPTCIRKIGDEYWIASYNQRIAKFDSNGSFLGYWIGKYANPVTESDAYGLTNSFTVDEANDRLYIVMRYYVRAFTLSTGAFIWSFGTGSSGNLIDNAIYTGTDIDLLPNGNVIVCSQNGKGLIGGVEGINHGHISEFNAATGALVACRLMYAPGTNGEAWQQSCYRPFACRVLNNKIYVSMNSGDHIGIFDVDTWDYLDTVAKPRRFDIGSVAATGLALNDAQDELVIAADSPKKIVGVGLADKDIHWYSGVQKWDDRSSADNRIGEFQTIKHILNVGAGRYMVADYGNNRVSVVGQSNQLSIPYSVVIPAGYKIKKAPETFNIETNQLLIDYADIATVGDIQLLLEASGA